MTASHPDDIAARIAALLAAIQGAEADLQQLLGTEVDAVLGPTGETYLLHDAKMQLVERERSYRQLFRRHLAILDALPAHIALIDLEGKVLAVNEAWRRFAVANFMDSSELGVGQNYLDICDTAVGACSEEASLTSAGIRRVLRREIDQFVLEYPCHSPTEQRWFRMMATSAGDDVLLGAVVMHVDVTERRVAENALRQSEGLMQIASTLARIGGWTFAVPGNTFVWSHAVCDIHDLPHGIRPRLEEVLALHPGEHAAQLAVAIAECTTLGTPFDLEVEVAPSSGSKRWVRILGRAERDEAGRIQAITGATQDITERRSLEQRFLRSQRMESIGTLAGGIAHDLNNVLAPILMSLELLRSPETSPEQLRTVATIEAMAQRGAELVKQVLSFARGVEGQRVELSLEQVIQSIAKIVRETFPKTIVTSTVIADGVPAVVGDPTQLDQVLMNLAVNARDAMPSGGTLTLSLSQVTLVNNEVGIFHDVLPGQYVVIEVEDTGSGIPATMIDRIFEPFYTTKEVGNGTGLGLSTSLAIIKSHGGMVRVYSEPGVGTRFRVYLPASTDAASPAAVGGRAATLARGHGELVLLVDDEPSIRSIASQMLQRFGYRVITAADGAEGVALYLRHGHDIAVILTDMMMPAMDGPEMIKELRRIDPAVRVIAASGLTSHGQAPRVSALAPDAFLAKPYTAQELLETLAVVLSATPPDISR